MRERMSDVTVGLVVVAAGSGVRLGADRPKALVELAGRPLLRHCLDRLGAAADAVVVVGPPTALDVVRALAEDCRDARGGPVTVVAGGATRTASVAAGIAALPDVDLVAVHDAARPLVDATALSACVAAVVAGADAAAPAVPVTDTLKRVGRGAVVEATVDREPLRAVQTPQVFPRAVLAQAHAGGGEATDDLALVEAAGGRVVLVDGATRYLKVTVPSDLLMAEALLAEALEGTA